MTILIAICGVLLAVSVFDVLRRSTLRRQAFRNIVRRPGEAALIIVGSMLGTAIITASFVVGDTIDSSIRDVARTELGEIDEVVTTTDVSQLDEIEQRVRAADLGPVDGILRSISTSAAAASAGPDRLAEPNASIYEIDFDEARAFGGDPRSTGLVDAGPTPAAGEAVIGKNLADDLDVSAGDPIELFAYGQSLPLVVTYIAPFEGLAGRGVFSVFVEPGTIARLYVGSTVDSAAPPEGQILVSNVGGVFDGVEHTRTVHGRLVMAVAGLSDADVSDWKDELLDAAEEEGNGIATIFSGIGGFSVIAGVLLLVNIFVMLSDERRTQLGILRAVGLKRNQVVRSFGLEGAAYAVVSAAVGAIVGVGVGWVIFRFAKTLISGDGFTLAFAFETGSLIVGALVGLAISLITVWLTSLRIANLNVIRAIRDLPEPRTEKRRRRTLVFGAFGAVAGAWMFIAGVSGELQIPTLAGPAVVAFSLIPLVSRFLPGRAVVTVLASFATAWGIAVFSAYRHIMENSDIEVFVVQGVVLVAGAVALVSANHQVWRRLQGSVAVRLGLAHPLERRLRTGLLLGMYALVIFTMTFLSVFAAVFRQQADDLAAQNAAGFDVIVDSNRGNPASVDVLAAQPEVTTVAPLLRAFADFRHQGHVDWTGWSVSGFDERMLATGGVELTERAPEYDTDRAVFDAVLADPSLVVVGQFFLVDDSGPPSSSAHVGDAYTMMNPVTDDIHELTVIGVATSDFVFNGPLVARDFLDGFMGPLGVESRHYIEIAPGLDHENAADALTGRLVEQGVDARPFTTDVNAELDEQDGFIRILQGYLGLGLVIGIAGLGVVLIRAVRERRRQIGMLRAMGFQSSVVRRAFLVEAAFIAIQGAVIGVALGLVSAFQVVTNAEIFGDADVGFVVPWLAVSAILTVPVAASLVAAVGPARNAARIRPAAALRLAD